MGDDITEYWVNKAPDELGRELKRRIQVCRDAWSHTALMWAKLERAYFGEDFSGMGADTFKTNLLGEQGEVVGLRSNYLRSIIQIQTNMVSKTVLALKAKARSGSDTSKRQAEIADKILPPYQENHGIPELLEQALTNAVLYGAGYLHLRWDTRAGFPVAPDLDGEEMVFAGDVKATVLPPYRVYFDPTWDGKGKMTWVAVEEPYNKYDVWARYGAPLDDEDPVKEDLKKAVFGNHMSYSQWDEHGFGQDSNMMTMTDEGDHVPVITFYHVQTPSRPDGATFQMIGDVLLTPALDFPYDRVPVPRIVPDVRPGNPFGFSTSWSLLGLQEQYDALISSLITGVDKATKSFWHIPPGGDISQEQFKQGGVIRSNETPSLLQFEYDIGPILQGLDHCKVDFQAIGGMNAVTMGDADKGILDNGKAMTIAIEQAFNRINDVQRAYQRAAKETAEVILELLRDNVGTKRTTELTGVDGDEVMENWSGEDLSEVDGITFDVVDPAMNHLSGRMERLHTMYEMGTPYHASQYESVLTTGRLDAITKPLREEERNILEENKLLREGVVVPVLPGDNPLTHLPRHIGEFNNIDLRMLLQRRTELGEAELSAAEQHIANHVLAIRDNPNELLAIIDTRLLDVKRMALEVEMMEMQANPPPAPHMPEELPGEEIPSEELPLPDTQ